MRGLLPAAGPVSSLSPSSGLPAPHRGLTDNPVRAFGLDSVGHGGPRDAAGIHIAQAARAFGTTAKQRAVWMHKQRVSRLYVSPAAGAAASPRHRQSAAMELTRWRFNGDRDEDCDRADGCDSTRSRAALSPPRWSYRWPALLAVRERAIANYADTAGKTWKPYGASPAPIAAVVPSPAHGDGRVQVG